MFVRPLANTQADGAIWDAYVQRADAATSDHCWGWRRVLSESFGYKSFYLGAFDDDRLVGILPLFRIPRGFGRCALSSIPFGNYGGVCADTPDAEHALLEAAEAQMLGLNAAYLDLRQVAPIEDERLRRHDLYTRFRYPLVGDPSVHLKAMSSSVRWSLRKAERGGATVFSTRDVNAMYPVHAHTMRRLGTPCFPRRYFEGILSVFGDKAELVLVCSGDRPIAYEIVLHFKQSMVRQFGGSLEEYLHLRPNQLLFWDSIERGCAAGMKELDYCRSRKDSGMAEYKRRLKFIEEPLGYQYLLRDGRPLPQRNPSNPKYQMLIRAWQRLPLAMTQLIGPPLIRYLA